MIIWSLFFRTYVFVSLLRINKILGQLWVPPHYSFFTQKVSLWKQELTVLSDISVTQPHAAYTFVHGVISNG